MVTLSVTRSRIAAVLRAAGDLVGCCGWDPERDRSLVALIDQAIGMVPGKTTPDAEDTSTAAWEALTAHLAADPREWELKAGRTAAEVQEALHASAVEVAR